MSQMSTTAKYLPSDICGPVRETSQVFPSTDEYDMEAPPSCGRGDSSLSKAPL